MSSESASLPHLLQVSKLRRPHLFRRGRRTRPASSSPLALPQANRLYARRALLAELATNTTHPRLVLLSARPKPILRCTAQHRPSDLALPPLTVLLALLERVFCKVAQGGSVVVVPSRGRSVRSDVLSQALARKSQHDENEVNAEGPETSDERDAHDAASLEDSTAQSRRRYRCTLSNGDGILASYTCRLSDDVDLADVELGARETGVFGNSGRNRVISAVGVVGERIEPDEAEESGVKRVDDRVERIQVG